MKYFNIGFFVFILIAISAAVSGAFRIEQENSLHHGDGAGCRGGGGHRRRGGRPTSTPEISTVEPEADGGEEVDI